MLKTSYKFIHFEEISWTVDDEEQSGWYCYNKTGDIIGRVGYYSQWKKWVFTSRSESIIFDTVCLDHISQFLRSLDKQEK